MDTNKVADTLYNALIVKHARVYRNEAPREPVFPYIVFHMSSISEAYPSEDYYVDIHVFDSPNAPVRVMEALADEVETLNHNVINTDDLTMQLERISRQFVSNADLIS